MATLLISGAGALLGGSLGIGANAGWLIGSAVGSFLFGEDQVTEGPRLNDLTVTASTYGKAIPIGYGTFRAAGNVIWSTGLIETKEEEDVGGKGGPSATYITYTYSASFAVAFCEGIADDVLRIWADTKLIYDKSKVGDTDLGPFGRTLFIKEPGLKFRFYNGSEDQQPDSVIAASQTEPNSTPAFRGLVYIVFDRLQLADFGNRIPSISVELTYNKNNLQPVAEAVFMADGDATGFDTSNLLVDVSRGVFYTAQEASGIYLRRFTLQGMVEDRQVNITTDAYGGPVGNLNLVAISPSGYIIASTSGGNAGVVSVINPESMTVISSFGTQNTDLNMSPTGFEQIVQGNSVGIGTTGVAGTRDFAVLGSQFNSIGILDVTNGIAEYVWDSDTGPEIEGLSVKPGDNAAILGVCAGEAGYSYATAYVAMGSAYSPASSNNMNLYRITVNWDAGYSQGGGGESYSGVTIELLKSFAPGDLVPGETLLSGAGRIAFDKTDRTVLIHALSEDGSESRLLKYDPLSDLILWNTIVPFFPSLSLGQAQTRVEDGIYGAMVNTNSYTIDTVSGEIRDQLSGWSIGRNVSGAGIWDSQTLTLLGMDNDGGITRWFFDRSEGLGEAASAIVSDICRRVDISNSEIDVSDLADETVEGFTIGRQITARSAIQALSAYHLFDGVESDYLLKFEKRDGKAVVRELTQSDLAPINDNGEFFIENRTQEIELPSRVSITYSDRERDYEQSVHSARRIFGPTPAMQANNELAMEYPGVAYSDVAKQTAEKILFSSWIERSSYELRLPWSHIDLDPGDVVRLTMDDGTVFRTRLTTSGIGVDYSLSLTGLSEEAAQYTSTVESDNGDSGLVNDLLGSTSTKVLLLSSPLLRDSDDSGRTVSSLYYFMGGYGQPNWRAGILFKSAEGTQYEQVGAVTREMAWGSAVNKLNPPAEGTLFATDEINTLTVALASAGRVPASCTQLEMVNGANAAAVIRTDGNPEIIQYRDVTTNANGTYTLSGLLRGRRGTDVFVTGHAAGDTVILLDAAAGSVLPLAISEQDQLRYYKGVTPGGLFEEAPTVAKASPLNDLKPYAPVNHKVTSGTWGSDITIEWERRTRVGGGLKDNSGTVPLSEDAEEYEVDILDGLGNVLRTQTALTFKSYTYTFANQTTDFPSGYVNKTATALTNAGFETGVTNPGTLVSGWLFGDGGNTIGIVTGAQGLISGAHAGTYYLSMNEALTDLTAEIHQDVDVSGYSKAIDAGSVSFRIGAHIASSQSATDTGRLDLVFLDADGAVISTTTGTERDPDNTGAWTGYTEAATAPVGTRFVRVSLNGTQVSSSLGIEVYWDAVTFEIDEGTKEFLNVAVYQISEQVGRGFAGVKQIEVA